jgi:hypothetical protein
LYRGGQVARLKAYGTVFELTKGSGTISTLVSFTGANGNGAYSRGGVMMDSGGDLYGTTVESRGGYDEVFELAHDSGTITDLALFNSDIHRRCPECRRHHRQRRCRYGRPHEQRQHGQPRGE